MSEPGTYLRSSINPDLSDNRSFADLYSYWLYKKNGRELALRRDFDPLELKAHLGSLFIAEPIEDGRNFRYRLIGTGLTEVHGRDFTGKSVLDLLGSVDPDAGKSIVAAYRKVLRDKVALRAQGRVVWAGKEFISFDSLHLPLSSDGSRADIVLGKLIFVNRADPP